MSAPKTSIERAVKTKQSTGMGEVYLAEDTKLDRKVALKILTAHLAIKT